LVHEIQRPVVDKRASFVAGKFEQLERNVPYSGLIQALRPAGEADSCRAEAELASQQQRLRRRSAAMAPCSRP